MTPHEFLLAFFFAFVLVVGNDENLECQLPKIRYSRFQSEQRGLVFSILLLNNLLPVSYLNHEHSKNLCSVNQRTYFKDT